MSKITVQTTVQKDLPTVWKAWVAPQHITKWAFASEDWEAPRAENDVRTGGRFLTRMAAKDGSAGFDFSGTYTNVVPHELIEYDMDGDGRQVSIRFQSSPDGVTVVETFDAETENSEELQRQGWQAILENFKKYVENNEL